MNTNKDKVNVYQIVTDRIIAALEAGTIPWRKPWSVAGGGGSPRNHATGKAYRGVNWFMLQMYGFESARWVTFKQAIDLGGNVRKGEKSALVTFWKKWQTKDKATGEEIKIPVLRYYNVFNLEQCDGIELPAAEKPVLAQHQRIESAEAIVSGMASRPVLRHAGARAYYSPALDSVTMPEMGRFTTAEDYYATLFHELAHATGHTSRLGRIKDSAAFGSEPYAQEELVAEMASAFLCARCGIDAPIIENSAAYVDGWIKVLKGDSKLAIVAAAQAAKAADFILGESFAEKAEEPAEAPAPVAEVVAPAGQLSLF